MTWEAPEKVFPCRIMRDGEYSRLASPRDMEYLIKQVQSNFTACQSNSSIAHRAGKWKDYDYAYCPFREVKLGVKKVQVPNGSAPLKLSISQPRRGLV